MAGGAALAEAWERTATTSTGTVTLSGVAAPGYATWTGSGAADGVLYPYEIRDGAAWEMGHGIYTASGTTLTRRLYASSTGSLLNLSGFAVVKLGQQNGRAPALASNFTVVTGGGGASGTLSDVSAQGLRLDLSGNATNRSALLNYGSLPATPFTMAAGVAGFSNGGVSAGDTGVGLCLRNSTNGRCLTYYFYKDGGLNVQQWSNLDTFSANVLNYSTFLNYLRPPALTYFGVNVTAGGTITFYYSGDGGKWISFGTTTVATYLTASGGGSLDQAGPFLLLSLASGSLGGMTVPYFYCAGSSAAPPMVY